VLDKAEYSAFESTLNSLIVSYRIEKQSFEKSTWVSQHVNMSTYNFFVSGPKFTKFFSFNRGGFVVDQAHFRFSLC